MLAEVAVACSACSPLLSLAAAESAASAPGLLLLLLPAASLLLVYELLRCGIVPTPLSLLFFFFSSAASPISSVCRVRVFPLLQGAAVLCCARLRHCGHRIHISSTARVSSYHLL